MSKSWLHLSKILLTFTGLNRTTLEEPAFPKQVLYMIVPYGEQRGVVQHFGKKTGWYHDTKTYKGMER